MDMFHMPERRVEQRTDEIYRSSKNRVLRFFRLGGSREDAKFVAVTQFLIESKIALRQSDVRTRTFAARIITAKTVEDIKHAVDEGIKEAGMHK